MGLCGQSLAAYDDGLCAKREEYRRCGGGVSWRGLSDSGYRSGRHGGLRLADVQGDHVRAIEVPRAGGGRVSEIGSISEIRAVSGIADGFGRRATDDRAAAFS